MVLCSVTIIPIHTIPPHHYPPRRHPFSLRKPVLRVGNIRLTAVLLATYTAGMTTPSRRMFICYLAAALCIFATTACGSANSPTATATPFPPKVVVTTPTFTPIVVPTLFIPTFTPTATQPPIPTIDSSTPAPPEDEWATYVYENTGITFKYPVNWFVSLHEEDNAVSIMNAPPNGVAAIKGYADNYLRIWIDLKPTNIETYSSIKAFIDSTVLKTLPPERVLSVEELPTLPQGYTAVRVTFLGLGELTTLYVANEGSMVTLSTSYVPGRKSEKTYLGIVEQIAGTLVIPQEVYS